MAFQANSILCGKVMVKRYKLYQFRFVHIALASLLKVPYCTTSYIQVSPQNTTWMGCFFFTMSTYTWEMYSDAGFHLVQIISWLTLGFLHYEDGSLLTREYCLGNLCCRPNLLQNRLNLRLKISKYEITIYWPVSFQNVAPAFLKESDLCGQIDGESKV